MPVYFEYAMKTSLSLTIIFIFYILFLRRMTYYIWNRYFLLIFSVFSFIVPFVNLTVFVPAKHLNSISFISPILSINTNKISENLTIEGAAFTYRQVLFAVYLLISSILFLRLLIQLLSIKKIRSKATLLMDGDVKLYELPEPILPFSFLNSIFINKDNYSQNELQEIIDHEKVHVQQKHSIDMLIAEIICIFNWYNPFAWLIKKAIRENLEFIADDAVIQKGVDRKNYQYLLLKVTGDVTLSITSNLKFASLKSRIRMMNKTKTSQLHLLKFALLVPIITLLLLAFRNKHEIYKATFEEQNTKTKEYILSSLTYSVPDKKVEASVKKDNQNCLLKTGEPINLEMVFNEKIRLKSLLEKNGYNNIGNHAITFMIDTTLGNNSFSVQVNINLAKDELAKTNEESGQDKINFPINSAQRSIESATTIVQHKSTNVTVEDKLSNKQLAFDNKLDATK